MFTEMLFSETFPSIQQLHFRGKKKIHITPIKYLHYVSRLPSKNMSIWTAPQTLISVCPKTPTHTHRHTKTPSHQRTLVEVRSIDPS